MPAMDAKRTMTLTGGHRSAQKQSAYLFQVFRGDRPLDPGARFSLDSVDVVELERADRLRAERYTDKGARLLCIGIPDPGISAVHCRLEKLLGSWAVEDRKSKNGTLVDGKRIAPADRSALSDGAVIEIGHTFFLFRDGLPASDPEDLYGEDLRPAASGLATLSPELAAEFERIARVSRASEHVPVLLQGETGTGKEVVARAIHALSGRDWLIDGPGRECCGERYGESQKV